MGAVWLPVPVIGPLREPIFCTERIEGRGRLSSARIYRIQKPVIARIRWFPHPRSSGGATHGYVQSAGSTPPPTIALCSQSLDGPAARSP